MPTEMNRRAFLAGSATAAVALTAAQTSTAAAAGTSLKAAVLEYTDQWTKGRGLRVLLERAGFEVIDLDPDRAATAQAQSVDLIAFGSFTNNAAAYLRFVDQQATSIQEFVASGRVVLDLAQSDQFGPTVAYLPTPLLSTRTDPDYDTIYPIDKTHPLVQQLKVVDGKVLTGRSTAIRVSYETLGRWGQMRVLLATAPGGAPPCLLEGQHGQGRFLVSSLTLDKIVDANGAALQPSAAITESETFFKTVAGYVSLVRTGKAPAVVPTLDRATGPLIGHTTSSSTRIWLRPGADHQQVERWQATLTDDKHKAVTVVAPIRPANDFTVLFDVAKLKKATRYSVSIRPADPAISFDALTASFATSTPDGQPAKVVMGLGSCAPDGPNKVWSRIVEEGCDSFVMLGDTPYIDSTNLVTARQKHQTFLQVPELATMISSMPIWATWDDHDFGGNDTSGTLAGKRNNRTAFVDYRANATFGHDADGGQLTEPDADGEGVYTSFRRGPVEVFLLDPRWFSRTEPSWADPDETTCLGAIQWKWLQNALRRSTATFKIIASGMIWDDKENTESDDWATYSYERDAIYDFVAEQKIKGVVLISGDIHVSRALNYGPRVGYDLWQYVVSPLHDRTIPSLNVPNPALVHSAVEPWVFLKLEADTTVHPATLDATWINRDGRVIFSVNRTADDLGY